MKGDGALYKITTFSFAQSFGVGSPGDKQGRLINVDGKAILTAAHWEIAEQAFTVLKKASQKANRREVSPVEIQNSFIDTCQQISAWLNDLLLPLLLDLFEKRLISIPGIGKTEFIERWSELGLVPRARTLVELMSMNPLSLELQTLHESATYVAAAATILCIDDAAIAHFLDEPLSLSTCSISAARFEAFNRQFVDLEPRISSVLSSAFSERAKQGASAKDSKYRQAREFVVTEWLAHRDAYESNKTSFARDYVRRVKNELDVKVTEKTIRESWLASTRLLADLPVSKQPGSD